MEGRSQKTINMEGISDFLFRKILEAVRQININKSKWAEENDVFDYLTENYKLCVSACDLHMTIYTALQIAKECGYVQEINYSYWATNEDPDEPCPEEE